MMIERRTQYPKVQVLGRWVSRPAKTDPLVREIQEAVNGMSIDRQVSSGAVSVVDGQTAENDFVTGSSQQLSQSSV